MAHLPSRSDTSPDLYAPFPDSDTPEPTVWAQTAAHPGYEQHGVPGANLPSDPDVPLPLGGSGTLQAGGNDVSTYTFETWEALTRKSP
jgi:hypothetical protein